MPFTLQVGASVNQSDNHIPISGLPSALQSTHPGLSSHIHQQVTPWLHATTLNGSPDAGDHIGARRKNWSIFDSYLHQNINQVMLLYLVCKCLQLVLLINHNHDLSYWHKSAKRILEKSMHWYSKSVIFDIKTLPIRAHFNHIPDWSICEPIRQSHYRIKIHLPGEASSNENENKEVVLGDRVSNMI